MPRRARESSNPTSVPRDRIELRREPVSRSDDLVSPPPFTVWGAPGHSLTHQSPRKRDELKCSEKPAASASLCSSWSMYQEQECFPHFVRVGQTIRTFLSSPKCSPNIDLLPPPLSAFWGCSNRSASLSPVSSEGNLSGFLPSKPFSVPAAAYAMGDAHSFLPMSATATYAPDHALLQFPQADPSYERLPQALLFRC